ncbi:Serine/threonine protein phosphatase 2A regulatory subunit B beta isoform [Monoraphidium neglectum]|uniref:Serine/threonine protein phosphatase 2A regulatory subunit B beta isoform n=1 Tax=Monoraphidium neglectum TaxID=145388 RepID=A0A0D2N5G7_9CHLO|nr:Serine/threonine protein phosphatase 2A regulatory subunit B beta isoform [Monoraphidium neglectum]KIZ01181.1 Serine/threonine protein phosphatase 2A regulatory subunit B beta isoform [Monoraphidium neglectum]|eukprot:XP_013900200.1 Serine/threonine protein phosphatase 2A regulatory subunit B beta isoform [Monoraphidium neglectum]
MLDKGPAGAAPGPGVPEWQFLQCFGERTPGEEVQEADVISTVEFDADGSYLATGDRGGRVVLFERVPMQKHATRRAGRPGACANAAAAVCSHAAPK